MLMVAFLAIGFGLLRLLANFDPIFGYSTVYSEQYDEVKFESIRIGMDTGEVEAILGPPLSKTPWDDGHTVLWKYSDQLGSMDNFWKRWIYIEDGKVNWIVNEFYRD